MANCIAKANTTASHLGERAMNDLAVLDLKAKVATYLRNKGFASLRRLKIKESEGTVTLSGTVGSFYERQLCISCRTIPGVHRVIDDVRVAFVPVKK